VLLKRKVPLEIFRPELKAIWCTPPQTGKSNVGRPPWDELLMFKVLILQQLYNLSDDQIEYQIRDRLSFMRFLELGVEDRVPDTKTVWKCIIVSTSSIRASTSSTARLYQTCV
jgi:hypothetical protein